MPNYFYKFISIEDYIQKIILFCLLDRLDFYILSLIYYLLYNFFIFINHF